MNTEKLVYSNQNSESAESAPESSLRLAALISSATEIHDSKRITFSNLCSI